MCMLINKLEINHAGLSKFSNNPTLVSFFEFYSY